jgi:hypothetical protein
MLFFQIHLRFIQLRLLKTGMWLEVLGSQDNINIYSFIGYDNV